MLPKVVKQNLAHELFMNTYDKCKIISSILKFGGSSLLHSINQLSAYEKKKQQLFYKTVKYVLCLQYHSLYILPCIA